MNWFTYLVETPFVQKKQDWAEYKKLKKELKGEKKHLQNAERGIYRMFYEEELFEEYDACMKTRVMLVRARNSDGALFDYNLMHIQESRCTNFVPVDDEQLCPCTNCPAFSKNKEYYETRRNIKEMTEKRKRFWKNKFAQNTK
jgi:hypothetical protein